MQLRPDAVFGGALFVVGAALFVETLGPGYGAQRGVMDFGISPGFFPRLVLCAWMVCALWIAFEPARIADPVEPVALPRSLGAAGLLCLYVAGILTVGFLFASVALAVALPVVMAYRRTLPIAVVAVLCPVAVWYIFDRALGIPLPRSPFQLPF